jgi:hypothetical protein
MKLTKAKLLEIVEEELQEIIRKSGDEFCLYSKKKNPKTGKKRNLGCYPSRSGAEKREREVQYFKSVSEKKEEFSSSLSPKKSFKVFRKCVNQVKDKVEPRPGTDKEEAASRICTDDSKEKGATLRKPTWYKKYLQRKRPGGKSGK